MTHTLICRDCRRPYEVCTLNDAWPWCDDCANSRANGKGKRKRGQGSEDRGRKDSPLETQFKWCLDNLDDAADLREYRRNFVFDVRRGWEFDFAWPERRVAVELQGGQWVGGKNPGAGSGRHTRGGHAYRDELAKHRAAGFLGWLLLCYTTDDITGKDQGIPAVVEVAAAYASRPTFGPDSIATLFPSLNAWEAAGGVLRVLLDSKGVPSADDRIAAVLHAWGSTILPKLANMPGDPAQLANPHRHLERSQS